MTYEFIYEFMYMKNIVKSYLNSGVPRFQMSNSIWIVFNVSWPLTALEPQCLSESVSDSETDSISDWDSETTA